MCQGRKAIQTNKKGLKIKLIFEEIKEPNFQKSTSELQLGKRTVRYSCANVFFQLFRPIKFLKIF